MAHCGLGPKAGARIGRSVRDSIQYSTKEGLTNNFIRAFLQGRDGSVWIATDEGVNRWRPRGITTYQMRDGLCYFSTRSMLEDRNGDIWIGTDRGVSRSTAIAL